MFHQVEQKKTDALDTTLEILISIFSKQKNICPDMNVETGYIVTLSLPMVFFF